MGIPKRALFKKVVGSETACSLQQYGNNTKTRYDLFFLDKSLAINFRSNRQ
jgi:hypothetical protein